MFFLYDDLCSNFDVWFCGNKKYVVKYINNTNNVFMNAIYNKHHKIVKLLLKTKIIDKQKMFDGFEFAIKVGYYKIIKIMAVDKQFDQNYDYIRAINCTANHGYQKIAKFLLKEERVFSDNKYNLAIKRAAKNGHYKIVKYLLKKIVSIVNIDYKFIINLAIYNNHYKIVKLLLKYDLIYLDSCILIQPILWNGFYKIIKLLMKDKRIDPSYGNNFIIHTLIKNKSTIPVKRFSKIIKILLKDERVRKLYFNK